MERKDQGLIKLCVRLENNALAVLENDRQYGNLPIEARTVLYKEMRKAVDEVRDRFSHLRGPIGQIKHEYDERGNVEGHRLFHRFSHHLPRYMRPEN